MRASLFLFLILLGAIGCNHLSVSSPAGFLDGTWQWQFNRNPSGSGITLSLTARGTTVVGSGRICGVGPACAPGPVTIAGQATGTSFQLTIKGDGGYLATYSGQVVGANELKGTWTQGSASNTVIFYRS